MRRLPLATILAVLGLSACAHAPDSTQSYVGQTIPAADDGVIAGAITGYVVAHLPPASSTLWLAPVPASGVIDKTSPLPALVAADLRKAGFALSTATADHSGAHTVRYVVSALDKAVLLRITIDRLQGSQIFSPSQDGSLAASSPMTEREASNEHP